MVANGEGEDICGLRLRVVVVVAVAVARLLWGADSSAVVG